MKVSLVKIMGLVGASALSLTMFATPGDAVAADKKEKHPGKKLFMSKTCMACHGRNGAKAILEYPNLAGQEEKYLFEQMKDIALGARVGSPDPTGNPRTKGMADIMHLLRTDEEAAAQKEWDGKELTPGQVENMKQLADWLSNLEPATPKAPETPYDPENLKQGEKLFKKFKCNTCHGKDGKKPLKGYPYIAGQKKGYLISQMNDIKDKVRTNGKVKTMIPNVKKAKPEELEMIAEYLSSIDRNKK